MTNELKNCAHCGSKEIATEERFNIMCREQHAVYCCSCHSHTAWYNENEDGIQKSIDAWNTRTSPWVSIEDELPEEHSKIFVNRVYSAKNKINETLIAEFYRDQWVCGGRVYKSADENGIGITHYMKIPNIPKETK